MLELILESSQKPFIVEDEKQASLIDWLKAGYGPMFAKYPTLLHGLVPDPAYTSQRIAEQLRRTGGAVFYTYGHFLISEIYRV